MNRAGILLGLLLVVQLFATVLLYRGDNFNDTLGKQVLVDSGAYVIDELRLDNGSDDELILRKSGPRWLLPDLSGLPADPEKVDNVLRALTQDDPGWAIAHTVAARQRFQVAHYHYRRKLSLLSLGDQVATVYLGTSPGFRKVHARNESQEDIYSLDLNLYDVPMDAGSWLEPRLLQLRAPIQINADGYSLSRQDGQWRLGSGDIPDQRELQALLDTLRNLRVSGIAKGKVRTAVMEREAELILDITSLAGNSQLALYKLGEDHFISSSKYPFLFRLSAYDYDKLTGIDSFILSGAQ